MPDPREAGAWETEPDRPVLHGEFGAEPEPVDPDRDDSEGAGADDPLPDLPDDDGERVES